MNMPFLRPLLTFLAAGALASSGAAQSTAALGHFKAYPSAIEHGDHYWENPTTLTVLNYQQEYYNQIVTYDYSAGVNSVPTISPVGFLTPTYGGMAAGEWKILDIQGSFALVGFHSPQFSSNRSWEVWLIERVAGVWYQRVDLQQVGAAAGQSDVWLNNGDSRFGETAQFLNFGGTLYAVVSNPSTGSGTNGSSFSRLHLFDLSGAQSGTGAPATWLSSVLEGGAGSYYRFGESMARVPSVLGFEYLAVSRPVGTKCVVYVLSQGNGMPVHLQETYRFSPPDVSSLGVAGNWLSVGGNTFSGGTLYQLGPWYPVPGPVIPYPYVNARVVGTYLSSDQFPAQNPQVLARNATTNHWCLLGWTGTSWLGVTGPSAIGIPDSFSAPGGNYISLRFDAGQLNNYPTKHFLFEENGVAEDFLGGTEVCVPIANSSGSVGQLDARFSPVLSAQAIELGASNVPAGVTVVFYASHELASNPVAYGLGQFCLGSQNQVVGIVAADSAGAASIPVSLADIQTWYGNWSPLFSPGQSPHLLPRSAPRQAQWSSDANVTPAIGSTVQ
ncbi:MAG: hypothetical protein R3F17_00035 [Planctomycetota bacterium]